MTLQTVFKKEIDMKNIGLKQLGYCVALITLSLLVFSSQAFAAPEDVTATVDQGTLHIKRAPGSADGFFGVGIGLEGNLDEDIRLSVNQVLQETIPRQGITAIEIEADQSSIYLGESSLFQFEGDIQVDVVTGGACFISRLDLRGDLNLSGSAGGLSTFYSGAFIMGNMSIEGGPGDDYLGENFSGSLFVSGDLSVDGGAGNEFIQLEDAFVGGETTINLGQSSGGEPNLGDKDFLGVSFSSLSGSLIVTGDEGDDDVFVSFADIGGDLLVDMGNGADFVYLYLLQLSDDALVYLDGGNGNSDGLALGGLPLSSGEYAGFETITP